MSAGRTNRAGRAGWLVAALGLLVLLVLVVLPVAGANAYLQNMLVLTFVLAVAASGWNLMAGLTGYISLGHGMFIGVGGYTAGILAARWEVSPFLVAPLGGVAAALVALLLALVTRRTRGAAFVIVSFATLELFELLARNGGSFTGGSKGFLMPLPSWSVEYQNLPFYYALLALLLLSLGMTAAIQRSKLGLGLVAIRDDEDKAAGIGVTAPVYKGIAFMASAVLVGVAGAVYGYFVSFLNPGSMFDVVFSMEVVLAVLLGGRGTLWGPVLGAFLLEPLAELTNTSFGGADAGAIRLIIFGGLLVAVALLLPRGILPVLTARWRRWREQGRTSPTGTRLAQAALPAAPPSERVGDRASRPAAARELLVADGISKRFGGITALADVSLTVPQGSITALIGPNGSGKTTLFNVIDGTYAPMSGRIAFAGADITAQGRTRRAHGGIGRTYQLPRLFDSLSVLQNVAATARELRAGSLLHSAVSGAEAARAAELLEFVGMADYVRARASDLSYGQRKLVELAQILMLDPALILLDEPAAGINPTLVARLGDLVRALNAEGRTFLIVEHDMEFVLSLSHSVTVLAHGSVLASGPPDEISRDAAVLEAYLGDDFTAPSDVIGSPR